ncbi:MAG: exodeoxyribonuclease VII large subunit, partial [Calditrichaeota bacterium]|nr:exodeoxyribonuclease VII large subunit [Calditrichota bacterium]
MKTAEEIYSVSHLSSIIRRLIEDGLPYVWVEGEISNLTLHGSGHRYFSLKDQNALI